MDKAQVLIYSLLKIWIPLTFTVPPRDWSPKFATGLNTYHYKKCITFNFLTRLDYKWFTYFISVRQTFKRVCSLFWFPAWTRPLKWSNILMTISWSISFCFILMRRIRFVQCSFVLWPCQICTLCSVYCIFAHLKTSSIQISFEKNDPQMFFVICGNSPLHNFI